MTKLVTKQKDLSKKQRKFLDELVDANHYQVIKEMTDELVNDEITEDDALVNVYDEKISDVCFENRKELEEWNIAERIFYTVAYQYFSADEILSTANMVRLMKGKTELDPNKFLRPKEVKYYEMHKSEWMKKLSSNYI